MCVRWQESLIVGHPRIDEDHRRILELANRLERAVASGQGHEVIGAVFCDLADYVVRHFSLEERLMERTSFPGAAEHRLEHDAFLRQLGDLVERNEITKGGIVHETCEFLNDWVASHVMGSDQALADFIVAHNGKVSRASEAEPANETEDRRLPKAVAETA